MSELNGQELIGEPCDAMSCFERGIVYSSGREVEIDLVEAHKWFNIAAAHGWVEAAQMRREIAALLSDAEIGRAQRAARDWLKANPLARSLQPVLAEIRAAA
jgi:TPR repeat protein